MPQLAYLSQLFSKLFVCSIVIIFCLLIWDLGWDSADDYAGFIKSCTDWAITIELISLTGLLRLRKFHTISHIQIIAQMIISVGVLVARYHVHLNINIDPLYLMRAKIVLTALLVCLPLFASFSIIINTLVGGKKKKTSLPPALLFLLTLISLIIVGSGLLMVPNATYEQGISPINAFFTCTSAVCVTGLNAVDFTTTFTPLGQLITLILIQLGGFGIMTFAYFIALILGQGFSLREKVMFQKLLDEDALSSTTKFLKSIVIVTFITEGFGALFLWLSWKDLNLPILADQPLAWHAIFHSVSAFCNAGFSTFPNGLCYEPIVQNRSSQLVIMFLIVMGGLGFAIYKEVLTHIKHWFIQVFKYKHYTQLRWTTHIYLALKTTLILIISGTIILFFIQQTNSTNTLPWQTTLWQSLFTSISTRTAGFNINSMTAYSSSAILIMCGLMMIGGCPGGTAGGVRTTTVAVVAGEIKRIILGRKDVEFNGRSIAHDVVERSIAAVVLSGVWVGTFTLISCYFEPNLNSLDLFFENASAFGTVGLSRDITSGLTAQTKILLMINMIAGRVGLFSFIVALAGRPSPRYYSYPSTKLPLN